MKEKEIKNIYYPVTTFSNHENTINKDSQNT